MSYVEVLQDDLMKITTEQQYYITLQCDINTNKSETLHLCCHPSTMEANGISFDIDITFEIGQSALRT